jgi:hypothetical protein
MMPNRFDGRVSHTLEARPARWSDAAQGVAEEERVRIGLHSNQLSIRGTEVAVWDYAEGLESRGHTVRIFAEAHSPHNDADVVRRFQERFDTVLYDRWDDVKDFEGLDFLYMQKAGIRDGKEPAPHVRYGVHAVFPYYEPHGDVYAYISRWLSGCMSKGAAPYVPYIVELPRVSGDMRRQLGIPASAVVLGRHGGWDTFDVPFVWDSVADALRQRDDLWFVFLNTAPGVRHEHVVYLDPTPDPVVKVRFIQTCDAMLHARAHGETFGLAPAEFSLCNRPVLTYDRSHERAHIDILGDKAILYHTRRDLTRLLVARGPRPEGDWNAYRGFCREAVMDQFESVFLGIERTRTGEQVPQEPVTPPKGYEGLYWVLRRAVSPNSGLGRFLLDVRRVARGPMR